MISHTLAALYLAYVVSSTHGPFGIFIELRQREPKQVVHNLSGEIEQIGLLTCFFCLVFWIALALRFLPRGFVDAAAVAGGASALYKYTGMGYGS